MSKPSHVDPPRYTPTQRRMLDVLADGLPHNRQELHACLDDELTAPEAIKFHISTMRVTLRRAGQDIVCELYKGTIHYRHVRLLKNPNDGKS